MREDDKDLSPPAANGQPAEDAPQIDVKMK
jgi:hypothetical protein